LLRRPVWWVAGVLLALVAAGFLWARPHIQAWCHLRAARAELERYHNPQAVRHLQACLRVWPRDPDVLLLAARAARCARNYAEAERLLEMYQQARGLDDAGSLEQLLLSAERNVDRVVGLCWRYVEQDVPEAHLILEALVRGYLRRYRLAEARQCLNRWLKSHPDNPQAACLEGDFHLHYAHARAAAEASYRRVVELDPDHEEARQGLAVTLLAAKRYAEAAEHLERLRTCQPDNLSVRVGLAECRDGMSEVEEAVRLADDVLAQDSEFAPALSLRGRLALKSGQTVQAETWLRQAFARNPSDHLTRYSLIRCLHANGKEEEARKQQRALQQLEEDLERFNTIVTKEMLQRPRDPALHCALGVLLLRGGHREEGLRWLQSALRLDPQYAPARKALAEYQQKTKAPKRPPGPGP
jgi:tetratricopeptide (TPR) repeat protein